MYESEPVFDRWGQHVAWKTDAAIHDLKGRAVAAFHRDGRIGSSAGGLLGVFDRGVFRDLEGLADAFVAHAVGGPVLPVPHFASPKPSLEMVTSVLPGILDCPTLTPHSTRWSPLQWDEFLAGRHGPKRA